jgi:hypothetical protein
MSIHDVKDIVRGATDLYVHASPDLLPRRADDLDLARSCSESGYRAAVHRHHFSSTVERSQLASTATGFDLRGALLLNDSVGGLNVTAVEVALRLGGRWIGLPTLSAARHREHVGSAPVRFRSALGLGPGCLTLVDSQGGVSAEVREILQLTGDFGAVVNLGYGGFSECVAAVRAAPGGVRLTMTNPLSTMGLTMEQVRELAGLGVWVELTAYSMHPDGPSRRPPSTALDEATNIIRTLGVGRCVLSSDGGMDDAPPPPDLLAWALAELHQRGFDRDELIQLTHANPALLLGIDGQ